MSNEYSEFYYHDLDASGLPYSCPVNPVHTIFKLDGTPEALQKAHAIVVKAWTGNKDCFPPFDSVDLRYHLGTFIIDIEANNFIPQFYDEIKAIDGIKSMIYVVYDTAYERMITNSESFGHEISQSIESRHLLMEVDDEPDMFPEKTEFSLPSLDE